MTTSDDTCPRCLHGVPSNAQRGQFEGLPSRVDDTVRICNQCSMEEIFLTNTNQPLPPRSKWPVTPILPRG